MENKNISGAMKHARKTGRKQGDRDEKKGRSIRKEKKLC